MYTKNRQSNKYISLLYKKITLTFWKSQDVHLYVFYFHCIHPTRQKSFPTNHHCTPPNYLYTHQHLYFLQQNFSKTLKLYDVFGISITNTVELDSFILGYYNQLLITSKLLGTKFSSFFSEHYEVPSYYIPAFFPETFRSFFAETFWSLKHFSHLSHSCNKTCCSNVH